MEFLRHADFTDVRNIVAGGALLLIPAHELCGERRNNLALVEERGIGVVGQRVAQALADAIRQKSGGGELRGRKVRRR